MTDFIEQLKKFGEIQNVYRNKVGTLENWKKQFQQLEKEVTQLITFFENQYEESAINDEFAEEVKAKLENRRDGIRLSVKSASRLLRKLNPEKPLEDDTQEFITHEVMSQKLKHFSEQQSSQEDGLDVVQFIEMSGIEEECKPMEPSEKVDEGEVNSELYTDVESSMEEEIVESNEVISEEGQEVVVNPENNKEEISIKIRLIQEAIENNQNVLQELGEHIQAAQKRFLQFIEKAVAPVLDGLYSGEKYGKDLVDELRIAGFENIDQVHEWLGIYDILMDEIKSFFHKFSVGVFSPEMGELFDEYKHEPIGVVEDFNFEDEQVKEVVRYGLTFENSLLAKETFFIRPSQVIVVKNKKQEIVEQQRGNQDEI